MFCGCQEDNAECCEQWRRGPSSSMADLQLVPRCLLPAASLVPGDLTQCTPAWLKILKCSLVLINHRAVAMLEVLLIGILSRPCKQNKRETKQVVITRMLIELNRGILFWWIHISFNFCHIETGICMYMYIYLYIFGCIKMGINRTLSCSREIRLYIWSIEYENYLCEVSHY